MQHDVNQAQANLSLRKADLELNIATLYLEHDMMPAWNICIECGQFYKPVTACDCQKP